MRYLLTLDVGTTAVKAGLFSEALTPVGFAINEYSLLTPEKDFVEMGPGIYWEKTKEAIRGVLSKAECSPSEIISITCTTQGETLIPVSESGNQLSNAVVWLDSRAKAEADYISAQFSRQDIYSTTGLPEINGYCPVAKILWIKNNLPEIYGKTHKFLLLEDYLIFRLSGKTVSNPALMCSTGYFNINTDCLWTEMLAFCDISADKIPDILPSGKDIGSILPSVAEELQLSLNTRVTTGAMDQVASAVGSGNLKPGTVTETTGTAQVVAASCEKAIPSDWSPVMVYRHAVENQFLKIVINQTAGIAYKWFRNEFCVDLVNSEEEAFDLMGELASKEPAASRGLTFFPHMTGIQFPQSDESLRGVFFGVGLDTNRGCFVRSIMEGVGYMLRESIEGMKLNPCEIISLGGGAKSDLWCQIKADISNTTIIRNDNEESTSLGAAVLGCIAMGIFKDCSDALKSISRKNEFIPNKQNKILYNSGYSEYKKMYKTFSPLFNNRK